MKAECDAGSMLHAYVHVAVQLRPCLLPTLPSKRPCTKESGLEVPALYAGCLSRV